MNLKFRLNSLRRRSLLFVVVLALSAAMLPTAAFASGGYGQQGRGWDPGPRQARGEHRPAQDDNNGWNHNNQRNNGPQWNNHQGNNRPNQCNATTYRVKRGDSLSEIARHFGVSVNQLAQVNGIRNPNRIYTGQVLCIPC